MTRNFLSRAKTGMIAATATAALLGLVACSPGGNPGAAGGAASLEEMEPITLSFTTTDPQASFAGIAIEAYQSYITEATDGKVTFENYWSSSLVPALETLEATGSGVVDIGYAVPLYNPDVVPTASWAATMGGTTDTRFMTGLVQGTLAHHSFFQSDESILAEYEAAGVRPLISYGSQRYPLVCNTPVETVAQAQGVQVRVGGSPWTEEVSSVGMSPTFTPIPELYEGLQRGIVDCTLMVEQNISSLSLWDVAKYLTPASFASVAGHVFNINLDVWNSMPAEVQQVFDEAAFVFFATYFTEVAAQTHDVVLGTGVADHGVEVLDGGEISAALADHQAAAFANMVDTAPGSVSDPQATVDSIQNELDRWADAWTSTGFPEETGDYLADIEAAQGVDMDALIESLRSEYFAAK